MKLAEDATEDVAECVADIARRMGLADDARDSALRTLGDVLTERRALERVADGTLTKAEFANLLLAHVESRVLGDAVPASEQERLLHLIEHAFFARPSDLGGSALSFDEDASDEEVLSAVELWIDDLARGEYYSAFQRTDHDPYYCWTPELIESVINGYGSTTPHPSGVKFSVTARNAAVGQAHYRVVDRSPAATHVADVWHDLPLNGKWSDLTATFRLERRGLQLRLVLAEIHVL